MAELPILEAVEDSWQSKQENRLNSSIGKLAPGKRTLFNGDL